MYPVYSVYDFQVILQTFSKDHTMLALAAEGIPSLEAKHNKDGGPLVFHAPNIRRCMKVIVLFRMVGK